MGTKEWFTKLLGQSYNEWLRSGNLTSRDILQKTTAKSLAVLQALQFQCQQGITMVPSQVQRVQVAMDHLIIEIRLLDTIREIED